MSKLLFCNASDWQRIYLDGELLLDGISHSAYDLAVIIMNKHKYVESFIYKYIDDWIENNPNPDYEEDWEYYDEFCEAMVKQYFN